MNKRLLISESRGDSNRCTPCRGNSGAWASSKGKKKNGPGPR
jgi:hypothetical protein